MKLARTYFGEGAIALDLRILQLTWQAHQRIVYEQTTFRLWQTFEYPGEGWGFTNDGRQTFMSDGTAAIRCWDVSTLAEKRRFTVHDGARPVENLNELESVRGEIYADLWQTDRVARFSPVDGRVTGWIDVSGLLSIQCWSGRAPTCRAESPTMRSATGRS